MAPRNQIYCVSESEWIETSLRDETNNSSNDWTIPSGKETNPVGSVREANNQKEIFSTTDYFAVGLEYLWCEISVIVVKECLSTGAIRDTTTSHERLDLYRSGFFQADCQLITRISGSKTDCQWNSGVSQSYRRNSFAVGLYSSLPTTPINHKHKPDGDSTGDFLISMRQFHSASNRPNFNTSLWRSK